MQQPEPPRPTIVVFDIDGVLADVRHRLHHVERKPKDWASFFAAIGADSPLEVGVALARERAIAGHTIVYLTGRSESQREITVAWLSEYGLPEGRLVMRRDDDRRPARLYKPEALRRIGSQGTVIEVIDDDRTVVEVLRAAGWPVTHATWMTIEADEQQSLFAAQEIDGRT
ncbi:MAG: HAD family acid phosphatase [Actinomycetes bacterium]